MYIILSVLTCKIKPTYALRMPFCFSSYQFYRDWLYMNDVRCKTRLGLIKVIPDTILKMWLKNNLRKRVESLRSVPRSRLLRVPRFVSEKVPHLSGEATLASASSDEKLPTTPTALQLPTSLMNPNNNNSKVSPTKSREMFPSKEAPTGLDSLQIFSFDLNC